MEFDNFRINASPYLHDVVCPKHRSKMMELDNGWFSVCWYCEECKYPYTLRLIKMPVVNHENLEKALEEAKLNLTPPKG